MNYPALDLESLWNWMSSLLTSSLHFRTWCDLMLHDLAIFGLTINLKCHLLWYLNYKLVPREGWKVRHEKLLVKYKLTIQNLKKNPHAVIDKVTTSALQQESEDLFKKNLQCSVQFGPSMIFENDVKLNSVKCSSAHRVHHFQKSLTVQTAHCTVVWTVNDFWKWCQIEQCEMLISTQSTSSGKTVSSTLLRGVGSYLKLGGQVVMWGHNLPPLVDVGLTDLPKPWWAISHSAHPSPTPLLSCWLPSIIWTSIKHN